MKLGLATREAYGQALRDLGRDNRNIVVLDADLSKSTMTRYFAELIRIAFSTWASRKPTWWGPRPVWPSTARFLLSQLRRVPPLQSLRPNSHGRRLFGSAREVGGQSRGHQPGTRRRLPNEHRGCGPGLHLPGLCGSGPHGRTCDSDATAALVEWPGPAYMRVGRPKTPIVYDAAAPSSWGRPFSCGTGSDITLIGNGLMVSRCLEAAERLAEDGISASGSGHAHGEAPGS